MLKQMLDEMIDSQKIEKSDDSKRKSDFKLLRECPPQESRSDVGIARRLGTSPR